ncbi:MAG: thioredoxin family protein [Anaerolineales bacterium]|jgi:thiol-disulfide isomerase/thioredoxin
MNPILMRALVALGLIAVGTGAYFLVNWLILLRAEYKQLGLADYRPGKPAVLYFTMEGCIPCKTTQRPALFRLLELTGDRVQLIEVDAVEEPKLAESWGVLSVPTTFIIDLQGRPRRVNHGVTLTEKLLDQLEKAAGVSLVEGDAEKAAEVRVDITGAD